MDFIDFDSFQDGENLPSPQPALSLPLASNIENFGKKFSNLNSLTRSLLRNGTPDPAQQSSEQRLSAQQDAYNRSKELALAEKYASMSLSMLQAAEQRTAQPEPADSVARHPTAPSASAAAAAAAAAPSASAAPSAAASKSSSLSSRLSRVLSSPMSDASIREVFVSLEQKLGSTDELVEAGIVGSMSRKALRSEIENDLIKTQSLVLREYSPAYKNLAQLEARLAQLNGLYRTATATVDAGYGQTKEFNAAVADLAQRKQIISLKKQLLSSFRKNYTLSEYEEHVLTSGDINEEFFAALRKAERIHANCSILLSSDNPKLGLTIMAKMNAHVTKSVARIVAFCNKTFGNLHSLNTRSRLATLHMCLKYLAGKQSYLNSVIAGFTESRAKVLVDEFLSQINGNLDRRGSQGGAGAGGAGTAEGGVGTGAADDASSNASVGAATGASRRRRRSSTSRPLVLSAHDPVRFIGDVLAYIHSVVVNEIETIQNIFNDNEQPVLRAMSYKMVTAVLGSLSRPLKSRVEQIVSTEPRVATIYSIYSLLELYVMMFEKSLGPAAAAAAATAATAATVAPAGDAATPEDPQDAAIVAAAGAAATTATPSSASGGAAAASGSSTAGDGLLSTVQHLATFASAKITSITRNKLLTIRHSNQAQLDITPSLQPPEWIIEFYAELLPILDSITTDTVMGLPAAAHQEFLSLVINEPIDIFNSHIKNAAGGAAAAGAGTAALLDKRDQRILRVNFLDLILSKIAPIAVLADKVLELHELMSAETAALTAIQLQHYYDGCGLTDYVNIVNMICPFTDDFFDVSIYQPIVENKLFTRDGVSAANAQIQAFLPTALMDVQQNLLKLNSPLIVSDVITNSSLDLVKFYLKLSLVVAEYLKEDLFAWSDVEVATLLGVDATYAEEKPKMDLGAGE